MNLTDEERLLGSENFHAAIASKLVRGKLMQETIAKKLTSAKGLGPRYFGYGAKVDSPVRVGVIGTGDEGGVLIGALNPAYVQVVAIADIRPYNVYRAFHGDKSSPPILKIRTGLMKKYGWADEEIARQHVKVYTDRYEKLLDDPDVEAVIIALPLHLHAEAAIKAMRKGKHVLCEKLMAHSVHECKEVARVAQQTGKTMVVGHQRHYSVLYDSAVEIIKQGLLGELHHIRAQWHRDNLPGNDSWQPALPDEKMQQEVAALTASLAEARKKLAAEEAKLAAVKGTPPRDLKQRVEDLKHHVEDLATKEEVLSHRYEDSKIAALVKDYGYQDFNVGGHEITALAELIRWRLWNRTGGGLMAELGSHQLDAAGIFISSMRDDGQHVRPLSVSAIGGRQLFEHDRDIDDHVYCSFEYPGPQYDPEKAPEKKIVVTYSSINGNGYGGYGETVLGTKGTLLLDREKDALLYRGWSTGEYAKVEEDHARHLELTEGQRGSNEADLGKLAFPEPISKGYTEEIEHWAWSIRNPGKQPLPRCLPHVALADAVVALVSNLAIAQRRRIEFDPAWFDPDKDDTPEKVLPNVDDPRYKI